MGLDNRGHWPFGARKFTVIAEGQRPSGDGQKKESFVSVGKPASESAASRGGVFFLSAEDQTAQGVIR
jgi:hypothetical protein